MAEAGYLVVIHIQKAFYIFQLFLRIRNGLIDRLEVYEIAHRRRIKYS